MSNWSKLTIFLTKVRGIMHHESQERTSANGSMSYLWREAGRKMWTKHRIAPDGSAPRPATGSLGQLTCWQS